VIKLPSEDTAAEALAATGQDGPKCPSCGYDLSGAQQGYAAAGGTDLHGTCPGCGASFEWANVRTDTPGKALWKAAGLAGPLAIAALALPPLGGFLLIGYMKTVADWLRSHADSGPLVYAGGFAILSGLALLPTYAQSALGGFAFGFAIGVPAALAGFVGGSIIGYEIARGASGDRVLKTIESKPQWKAVREAFVSGRAGGGFFKTLGTVALLRLPPNSPFAITNLVMASVRVPRVPYVLGTLIGMAPRTAAAVWVGTRVQQLTSTQDIANATPKWFFVAGLVLMFVVLGVIGLIANRAIKRVTGVDMRKRVKTIT
jgi:uncharacterized membrane protein YdjX (TVP38/TMEM64 family)